MSPNLQWGEPPKASPVVAAMSGGVDSSVAAALLHQAGHEVIGVTLKLQDCREARGSRSCCGIDGGARARAVAGHLGIPHYVLDCAREFGEEVLRPAWNEYAAGRTPSPCLFCNERIKFGLLLAWARRLGASLIATGHYARIAPDGRGEPSLLRGEDREKDQSYFLAGLSIDQLRSVLFPIGRRRKHEVRELARSAGLPNADSPDSQDACLVGPDQSFAEMLRERFQAEARPGSIVTSDGRVLGRHPGIHRFTVGQRRGLDVRSSRPYWVKSVQAETASVVVTEDEDELFTDRLVVAGINWLGEGAASASTACQVQVRSRQEPEPAALKMLGAGVARVIFARPVRAVTPGQAAVFYDGARVLGRGWIHGTG
ncbi:MAG: tRNA 2-thiouridine(34) synthase MnmA [PVC group bacterium]